MSEADVRSVIAIPVRASAPDASPAPIAPSYPLRSFLLILERQNPLRHNRCTSLVILYSRNILAPLQRDSSRRSTYLGGKSG